MTDNKDPIIKEDDLDVVENDNDTDETTSAEQPSEGSGLTEDLTLNEAVNQLLIDNSWEDVSSIYAVINNIDDGDISEEDIVRFSEFIANLGTSESSILQNIIVEEIKERAIPGYELITSLDEMLAIYNLYKSLDIDEIAETTTEIQYVIKSLTDIAAGNTSGDLNNELFDYYFAQKYPQFYEWNEVDGFILKDRSLSALVGDVFSSAFSLLPFVAPNDYVKFTDEAAKVAPLVKAIQATLSESPEILDDIVKTITGVIKLANIAIDNNIGSISFDINKFQENLLPIIVDLIASGQYGSKVKDALLAFGISEAMQGILDIASYSIPYIGVVKLGEDIFNAVSDGQFTTPGSAVSTDMDLLIPYVEDIPGTIIRYAEGLRYVYNPIFGNKLLVDNGDPLTKGTIITFPSSDTNTLGNLLLKIPVTGKYAKAVNLALKVVGWSSKLYGPVSNLLQGLNTEYDGTFEKRTLKYEYSFEPLVDKLLNDAQTIDDLSDIATTGIKDLTDLLPTIVTVLESLEGYDDTVSVINDIITVISDVEGEDDFNSDLENELITLQDVVDQVELIVTENAEDSNINIPSVQVALDKAKSGLSAYLLARRDTLIEESKETEISIFEEGVDNKWKDYY
jgi:hypothetical protein